MELRGGVSNFFLSQEGGDRGWAMYLFSSMDGGACNVIFSTFSTFSKNILLTPAKAYVANSKTPRSKN